MRRVPGMMLLAACLAAGVPSLASAALAATPLPRGERAVPVRAKTHVVTIEAMRFAPAALTVHAGDTVTWKNKDPFPHNVRSADKVLRSPDVASGGSWKFKARRKGTYAYVCTLHPGMKGVLVVD